MSMIGFVKDAVRPTEDYVPESYAQLCCFSCTAESVLWATTQASVEVVTFLYRLTAYFDTIVQLGSLLGR